MTITLPPKLSNLPSKLPLENAIKIELEEGIPILRASDAIQNRIENLLSQQKITDLTAIEEEELNCYEEIDDYLSFLNRMTRNFYLSN